MMNVSQPSDSNLSYDEMLHTLFSNNIDTTTSSSYQANHRSTILLDLFSIPNSINEVQESYDLFSFLRSKQTAQTPDTIQNHKSPIQPPNKINRTPFQLGKCLLPIPPQHKHFLKTISEILNTPNMNFCTSQRDLQPMNPPPAFIQFSMNNLPTQIQSISPLLSSELTHISHEEFSLNHHCIKNIISTSLCETEKHPISV
ncbi:hypothetical protein O181_112063 [Austropuccinia psidii MF-1]|uniref:Uncharacterized protein n=1 Tax=Austropuccinia psidii MF-1 TaxID=1389203 RepID=A0A9Q3JZR6_9BASI|nr:hypothetical protein [Austropuccinia psidii MF-1]